MRCGDVMNTRVFTCSSKQSAADCARLMRDEKVNMVPIVDDKQRVLGIVTARDLVDQVLADDDAGADMPASQVMREVHTCQSSENIAQVRATLSTRGKAVAVVVSDDGHCIGMVNLRELSIADENLHSSEFFRPQGLAAARRTAAKPN